MKQKWGWSSPFQTMKKRGYRWKIKQHISETGVMAKTDLESRFLHVFLRFGDQTFRLRLFSYLCASPTGALKIFSNWDSEEMCLHEIQSWNDGVFFSFKNAKFLTKFGKNHFKKWSFLGGYSKFFRLLSLQTWYIFLTKVFGQEKGRNTNIQ